MSLTKRTHLLKNLGRSIKLSKITILIGPRQIGKTTLVKEFIKNQKKVEIHFFDLEDPTDFDLLDNSKLTLEPLDGLIVIDEVQRKPELFKYLRVKADQMGKMSRILLLGSSSRDLIEQASETLAGRINYIEVPGFSIDETHNIEKLFVRGCFPLSFSAKTEEASYQWRKFYTQAYLERDLKTLGIDLPSQSLRRMLEMMVGYHGQIFNSSEIGKSLGFSHTTARKYLDILISTFLIRELKPWHESIIQRQVKQSKIYFRDSGLVNYFMAIHSKNELYRNPKLGHLWEGFALEETIKLIGAENEDLYFWALHQNGELDLLWKKADKKLGFEFKYTDHPKVTSSMEKALELINLDHLYIIYPGSKKAKLHEKISLIPLGEKL